MKRFTFNHWDAAFNPNAWKNFTMPLLPMSMHQTELR